MKRTVAPVGLVFTVVHIADSERDPQPDLRRGGTFSRPEYLPGPNADTGATLCGHPMLVSEVWVDYQPSEDDRYCGACTGDVLTHEQDALL